MDAEAKIDFLKKAIASQRTTLRLLTGLALGLFFLGGAVVVLSFTNPDLVLPESLRAGQTLGGTLLLAISGSIPMFTSRRDKIVALRYLLKAYEEHQRDGLTSDQRDNPDRYFDQYFAKVLGG